MKLRTSALILLPALALGVCSLLYFSSSAQAQKPKQKANADTKTYSLFNGKNLKGWKVTEFGGQGEVEVKKKQILIPLGQDMSGITYDEKTSPLKLKLPKENYEISLEAMRVDGTDFFCGMTFPVGDEFCSLVLGGWGGGVVGLSSIHGFDASENDTTQYVEFENKRWYKVRLRVTTENIAVWLDDKEIIDLPRKDNEFSIRFEMELCKPLGFATWQTVGALRNISLTLLEEPAAEEGADKKAATKKAATKKAAAKKAAANAPDEGDNEPSPSDRVIKKPTPETKPETAEAPVEQPPLPETASVADANCASLPITTCANQSCVQSSCRQTRCRVNRCRQFRGHRCRSFRRCR